MTEKCGSLLAANGNARPLARFFSQNYGTGSIACRLYPRIMMRIVLISFSCDTQVAGRGRVGGGSRGGAKGDCGRRWTRVNVSRRYGRSAKGRRDLNPSFVRARCLLATTLRVRETPRSRREKKRIKKKKSKSFHQRIPVYIVVEYFIFMSNGSTRLI
ncbi:hypothetical protein PUN28_010520 [Cardiocondyla obscurior]|uniref:Uncharacterized protein n=1 Tax=Cardiocondyla obscurior TaxID=286306 RepID=A0AAW2FKV9_9HYME